MTGKIIVQQLWESSMVTVGDRISGECVTSGRTYTGTVADVHGPIRSPDCGGYRYRLTDTGQTYANGSPIEPTVFALMWES